MVKIIENHDLSYSIGILLVYIIHEQYNENIEKQAIVPRFSHLDHPSWLQMDPHQPQPETVQKTINALYLQFY